MSNTIPAAGEAMPKLPIDLGEFSLGELATTHDLLKAVSQILSGLESQPRCQSKEPFKLNKAGELIDSILDLVNGILSGTVDEALKRTPKSSHERSYRFFLGISDEVWTHADPECVGVLAQALIDEMPSEKELEAQS